MHTSRLHTISTSYDYISGQVEKTLKTKIPTTGTISDLTTIKLYWYIKHFCIFTRHIKVVILDHRKGWATASAKT